MDIQNNQQITKKERKQLRRQERLESQNVAVTKRRFKKITSWGLWGGLTIAVIGGLIWYVVTRPPVPESDIVSRSAFHWHPELAIYVKGEKQEIPANIGIGAVHQPIHTHDDSDQGIVHLEFQGMALKKDVTLGQFLKNWGKDINSFGTNMTMTVNGEESAEYENYVMRDKDKIKLNFD